MLFFSFIGIQKNTPKPCAFCIGHLHTPISRASMSVFSVPHPRSIRSASHHFTKPPFHFGICSVLLSFCFSNFPFEHQSSKAMLFLITTSISFRGAFRFFLDFRVVWGSFFDFSEYSINDTFSHKMSVYDSLLKNVKMNLLNTFFLVSVLFQASFPSSRSCLYHKPR